MCSKQSVFKMQHIVVMPRRGLFKALVHNVLIGRRQALHAPPLLRGRGRRRGGGAGAGASKSPTTTVHLRIGEDSWHLDHRCKSALAANAVVRDRGHVGTRRQGGGGGQGVFGGIKTPTGTLVLCARARASH